MSSLAKPAPASVGAEAPDFSLLDQEGRFHQLRHETEARAVVLMFTGNGCPIARQNATKLKALRDRFEPAGVRFWLINSNPQDDRASIAAEAHEFEQTFPILKDDTQLVARSFGVKRTAEFIVIEARDWTVAYRGALDDQAVEGAVRTRVEHPYVADALTALLEGKSVATRTTRAAGCLIHFEDAAGGRSGEITYAKDVAPILQQKCVGCHSAGNIGPFALSSYKKAKGEADMMREVVLNRRMPPWHADPQHGVFQEDRSLTSAEMATLLSWLDAGAPRGHGDDPLAAHAAALPPPAGWPLGQPDFVVKPTQRMEIPATGVLEYITNVVDSPIIEDAWLKGAVIRPDNRKVLHHVIVYVDFPSGHPKEARMEDQWLVGWAPGAAANFFPEGTGKFLPKGSRLRFQLHYTTNGKAESDQSELGLYLLAAPPAIEVQMLGVTAGEFSIPPGAADHRMLALQTLARDTLVYSLSPHMHKRGSWFRYEALYPDGRSEVLLSVPKYDFNWQTTYRLAQPKRLPAGTRILCTGGFDNSRQNLTNPGPDDWVHWGEQSFDEMFIGFMTVAEAPAAVVSR